MLAPNKEVVGALVAFLVQPLRRETPCHGCSYAAFAWDDDAHCSVSRTYPMHFPDCRWQVWQMLENMYCNNAIKVIIRKRKTLLNVCQHDGDVGKACTHLLRHVLPQFDRDVFGFLPRG